MNDSYIPEPTFNSQFPDFSENAVPDKELIHFYNSEITELKKQYKLTRSVNNKIDIKKQIKFFEAGVRYLIKKYGKNSTPS
jgi:hypothetical protein